MCLQQQTDVNSYPESGIGYKVFVNLEPNLYKGLYKFEMYVRDQEFTASDDNLWDNDDLFYRSGFHIFPELKGAQNLLEYFRFHYPARKTLIVRVSYRERHTCGVEQRFGSEHPVIVAKYMTLLDEVE